MPHMDPNFVHRPTLRHMHLRGLIADLNYEQGDIQKPMTKNTDVSPDDNSDIAKQQASAYADAVGQSVPLDIIDKIQECAKSATPYPAYQSNSEIPFVYEILQFKGWKEMVLPVVQTWIEVCWLQAAKMGADFHDKSQVNFERATATVKRSPTCTDFEHLRCGFCIFRLKEHEFQKGGYWTPISKEHGLNIHLGHAETIVFIPLEDLGPENGFFMPLKYGQDVCVDGRANISFPASGGGTGIFFALKI